MRGSVQQSLVDYGGVAKPATLPFIFRAAYDDRLGDSTKRARWTPASVLVRAKQVLREEGLKSLWFKVLGETVYRRQLLIEGVLQGSDTDDDGTKGHISLLGTADLPRYAAFRPESDIEELRGRLDRGESCFVMEIGGEIAHACWIAKKYTRIDYLECEVELPPDACYGYDAYTHPAFRGRGIAGARVRRMETELMRMGYRRTLAVVGPENRRAIYFNTTAGNEVVGRIGYYQFGPWRHYFCNVDAGKESAALLDPRRA